MKLGSLALAPWWSQRVLREKLLVMAAATVTLLGVGHSLVTAPLEKRIRSAEQQTQTLLAQAQALAAERGQDADRTRSLREQEQLWRDRLATAQQAAATAQRRAADAGRLPETLRALVATVGSAELLALDLAGDVEATPSTVTSTVTSTVSITGTPAAGPRLYKLPITLKVRGPWPELNTLLNQIERHADTLQWQSLSLDNTPWPAIELTLKAHVLSQSPRWGAP